MRLKMIRDIINQCQVITSASEECAYERAQGAIERIRILLNGLEVLCGSIRRDLDKVIRDDEDTCPC